MTMHTARPTDRPFSDPVVVGGGIGGLTFALAMAKQGKRVSVFEKDPAIQTAGAGLTLGVNAMRVFQDLGVATDLLARGSRFKTIRVKSHDGSILSEIDNRRLEADLGMPSIGIHRASLHESLLQHLPTDALHLGEAFASYSQTGDHVTAQFESGSIATAPLLIGADGIGSSVGRAMLGQLPRRDARQICFRGVCDADGIDWDPTEMFEAWGKGRRFGVVPIGQGKIYWFSTLNRGSISEPPLEAKAFLIGAFEGWCDPVFALLSQTEPELILRNDLYDRPPLDRWHDGRVVLLGDAAHPTTPNMGQGAGMAIESAAVLAHCLRKTEDLTAALSRYEQLRMTRTRAVTNQSWRIGQIATLSNAMTIHVRNFLVKQGSALAYRQACALFDYDIYTSESR